MLQRTDHRNRHSGRKVRYSCASNTPRSQLIGLAARRHIGDPEQRMQMRNPPLPSLDVGLDQIARLPGGGAAPRARKLGGDEFGGGAQHHLLVEPLDQFIVKAAGPGQESVSRIAVRIVMSPRACRIDSSTERVAWPTSRPMSHQAIQNSLGDLLAQAVCL